MLYLTKNDFEKIEKALGIKLPEHYKIFHLTEKELLKKLRESDPWPEDHSIGIATDVNYIIEMNTLMKLPSTSGPVRNKLAIGGDGCGGNSFMDITDPGNTTIFFLPHDEYEHEEIFDEDNDDFRWDHEGLKGQKSLKAYTSELIRFNEEVDS